MVSSKYSLSPLTQPGQYFEYGSAIVLTYQKARISPAQLRTLVVWGAKTTTRTLNSDFRIPAKRWDHGRCGSSEECVQSSTGCFHFIFSIHHRRARSRQKTERPDRCKCRRRCSTGRTWPCGESLGGKTAFSFHCGRSQGLRRVEGRNSARDQIHRL